MPTCDIFVGSTTAGKAAAQALICEPHSEAGRKLFPGAASVRSPGAPTSRGLRLVAQVAMLAAALAAAGPLAGETIELPIKALDPQGRVLEGIRFAFGGVETPDTTEAGVTHLPLPQLSAGQAIKLDLPRSLSEEWFLIDATVHAPAGPLEGPAEVVVMRRAELRQIAAETRDASGRASQPGDVVSESQKREILLDRAAQCGLTEGQLEAAITAFSETDDPQDRGIAAYLAGEYEVAEAALQEAAENQEEDFIETLRYLGATQYAQADFSEAAATFRKAAAMHNEDTTLLNWLGIVLHELALWEEAELLLRRALAIDEASDGSNYTDIARDLSNLARLLLTTNRHSEAEPLMRRALKIDQTNLGDDHPTVAIHLNSLAQLLTVTNRHSEAEPLMRRALEINHSSYGGSHPNVATSLSSLAWLLHDTNRHSEAEPLLRRALEIHRASYGDVHPYFAISLNNLATLLQDIGRHSEAEPLLRRALEIDQASYGSSHPNVASDLNNLGALLQDTNRLSEAEHLLRQALAIDLASFGDDHPSVARDRGNLASILQAKNRFSEAEPLMRRALEIDQASFGDNHPRVAIDLNNLAQLLQATRRHKEAEPLLRRALEILQESLGDDHPNTRIAQGNLDSLLSVLDLVLPSASD